MVLSASDLHKSYGDLEVLKGISLEIATAEVVSIVGASGAGKSTLLHILGTLDLPDAGSLKIANTDIGSLKRDELAQFRNSTIGFVFQFHNLLPEFTALENVCMPALIAGQKLQDAQSEGKRLLKMLGLSHRLDHKPSALSGGEQQRTAVARALINQPSIIFADEPSGNLDSKNADELHNLFFQLRDQFKQTFVIVTHNQAFANMADRKLEIKDGKVLV